MLRLFLTKTKEWLSHEVLSERMSEWPEQIKTDILSFKRSQDATLSFLGKCLVSHGFRMLDVPFSWNDISFNEKGRPLLSNHPFDFNISHSGDMIAVVIGTSKVGVDIEQHRKVDIALFNRQFSEKEWQSIHQSTHPQKRFFELWTIKEAAIKADGRGVSILSKTQTSSDQQLFIENHLWHYICLDARDNYSLCIVHEPPFQLEDIVVTKVSQEELLYI